MSLDPSGLRESLRPLFEPSTMPTGGIRDAVRAWLDPYVRYASSAIAGGTGPSTLNAVAMDGPDFLTALDASLRAMWMSVVWAGPGLAGVTALVPPLGPFILAAEPTLFSSTDPRLPPLLIAEGLHTYTLSITVTVTPISGTPFVAPLT